MTEINGTAASVEAIGVAVMVESQPQAQHSRGDLGIHPADALLCGDVLGQRIDGPPRRDHAALEALTVPHAQLRVRGDRVGDRDQLGHERLGGADDRFEIAFDG